MKQIGKPARRAAAVLLALVLAAGSCMAASAEGGAQVYTTVVTENTAPIAENLSFTTYRNIPVRADFAAVDPDGDPVTFSITAEPKKGTAALSADGTGFVYTPKKNKKGTDSFSYIAVDARGNTSPEATVTIRILKQSTDVYYEDMADSGSHYAALRLAEEGVLVGSRLGGAYFFSPDDPVTRGEFLAMCLQACGAELLPDITKTGFYDDSAISAWTKPYVATALMSGVIRGYTSEDGHVVFSADAPITLAEASVMLNNILGITDVSGSASDDCPVWAAQAAVNLSSCRVPAAGTYGAALTRAEAAEMLAGAMDVLDARKSGGLLSWAR